MPKLWNIDLDPIHTRFAFNRDQDKPSPVDPLHFHQVAARRVNLDRRVLRLNDEFLGFHDSGSLHPDRTELFQVGFIAGLLLFLGCSEQTRYFSSAYLERGGTRLAVSQLRRYTLMKGLNHIESNPILQGVGQYTIELISLVSSTLRRGGLEDGIYEVGVEISSVSAPPSSKAGYIKPRAGLPTAKSGSTVWKSRSSLKKVRRGFVSFTGQMETMM